MFITWMAKKNSPIGVSSAVPWVETLDDGDIRIKGRCDVCGQTFWEVYSFKELRDVERYHELKEGLHDLAKKH